MTDKAIKYLSDIQYAISLINDFLKTLKNFRTINLTLKHKALLKGN